jgi:phage-related minor tail protein
MPETEPSASSLETVESLAVAMDGLNRVTERFGQSMTTAFARGIVSGRSFDTVLRGLGQRFVDIALQASLKPVSGLLDGLLSGLAGGFGRITPFANGGVIGAPTLFPMGGSLGLAGEAGPEAVMPLARGADGKLGVRGGGGGVTVNVSIAASDVESFRRSEAQIAATLARAVARGQRGS